MTYFNQQSRKNIDDTNGNPIYVGDIVKCRYGNHTITGTVGEYFNGYYDLKFIIEGEPVYKNFYDFEEIIKIERNKPSHRRR